MNKRIFLGILLVTTLYCCDVFANYADYITFKNVSSLQFGETNCIFWIAPQTDPGKYQIMAKSTDSCFFQYSMFLATINGHPGVQFTARGSGEVQLDNPSALQGLHYTYHDNIFEVLPN